MCQSNSKKYQKATRTVPSQTALILCCLLSLLFSFTSCGATKHLERTASAETATKGDLGSLQYVQKVYDTRVYTKNISGKMDFRIQAGDKDVTVPGQLRMRRDSVIRIQLFIPLLGSEIGRLEFTPTYVLIIDRMHKQYVKADYRQVDFLQQHGITFYSLQALFWNQLLVPGNKTVKESDLEKFSADAGKGQVSLKDGNMNYLWTCDPASGQIKKADVTYQDKQGQSSLSVDYAGFTAVGVKQFPANIVLNLKTDATKRVKAALMSIDMHRVTTDSNWETQTTVSDRYTKVDPKDILSKITTL